MLTRCVIHLVMLYQIVSHCALTLLKTKYIIPKKIQFVKGLMDILCRFFEFVGNQKGELECLRGI